MKEYMLILFRAVIILGCASLVGLGVNLIRPKPLPWTYVPPKELDVQGVKIPLIDDKAAHRFFGAEGTVFWTRGKRKTIPRATCKARFFSDRTKKKSCFPQCSHFFRRMLV